MPQVTATSNAVAYDFYAALNAIDARTPRSVAGLQIQADSGNGAGVVKIGVPNAAGTDIPSPDVTLLMGESYPLGPFDCNCIPLKGYAYKSDTNGSKLNVTPSVK